MADFFRGQQNGLCGAAVAGGLFLITGLHTGQVGFTVDVLDAPPPHDDMWEEVVEASFQVGARVTDLALIEWGWQASYPLQLQPGSYRVRYCALGMERGKEIDTTLGDVLVDFYSLAFWPAEAAGDRVLKQTSEVAAYWHEHARGLGRGAPEPV
jgi:carbohydrate-selective porin OprB